MAKILNDEHIQTAPSDGEMKPSVGRPRRSSRDITSRGAFRYSAPRASIGISAARQPADPRRLGAADVYSFALVINNGSDFSHEVAVSRRTSREYCGSATSKCSNIDQYIHEQEHEQRASGRLQQHRRLPHGARGLQRSWRRGTCSRRSRASALLPACSRTATSRCSRRRHDRATRDAIARLTSVAARRSRARKDAGATVPLRAGRGRGARADPAGHVALARRRACRDRGGSRASASTRAAHAADERTREPRAARGIPARRRGRGGALGAALLAPRRLVAGLCCCSRAPTSGASRRRAGRPRADRPRRSGRAGAAQQRARALPRRGRRRRPRRAAARRARPDRERLAPHPARQLDLGLQRRGAQPARTPHAHATERRSGARGHRTGRARRRGRRPPAFPTSSFPPSSSASSARRRSRGSAGLGLAIVRAVAESTGGRSRWSAPADPGSSTARGLLCGCRWRASGKTPPGRRRRTAPSRPVCRGRQSRGVKGWGPAYPAGPGPDGWSNHPELKVSGSSRSRFAQRRKASISRRARRGEGRARTDPRRRRLARRCR